MNPSEASITKEPLHSDMPFYVLDAEGCPIKAETRQEWYEFFNDNDRRRMALTEVGDVRVSTVFLGIDHDFSRHSDYDDPTYKPVIFETMVFGGPLDEECERYRTPAEWRAGHEKWVERVKAVSNDRT